MVAGEPKGTFVIASDRSQPVYLGVEQRGDRWVIPAQQPTGQVYREGGRWVTKLYGSQLGGAFLEDPVQGVVTFIPDELSFLRSILKPWVGILAATILFIATNAGLIGASRLAYSLGQHRQIPPVLGRLHPKRMTPWLSIVLFGTVACILILPGKPKLLADLYAFGAMISFTTAHVSVVALRYKAPDVRRPFRTPLNIPFRGGSLPLLAVIGGIGTFAVWCVVVATHAEGRIIGFAWMAAGVVLYVVYRRRKGLSLTRTAGRVVMPRTMQADIDYDNILVPIVGSRITDEMMVLACQLAAEKDSGIDAIYVIEVPIALPLEAPLPHEREQAKTVLAAAQLISEQFKVKLTPHIITARSVGKAIVEEAEKRRSEVIILGSVRKRRVGDRLIGKTAEYVMRNAPCEVMVNLVPRDYPMEGSAEELGALAEGDAPD